jgi:hypothetical protein
MSDPDDALDELLLADLILAAVEPGIVFDESVVPRHLAREIVASSWLRQHDERVRDETTKLLLEALARTAPAGDKRVPYELPAPLEWLTLAIPVNRATADPDEIAAMAAEAARNAFRK